MKWGVKILLGVFIIFLLIFFTSQGRILSYSVMMEVGPPELRRWTVDRLWYMDEVALPSLTEALEDEDPEVRQIAIRSMLERGPAAAPALPAIIERLGDDVPEIRRFAAETLAAIGPDARDALPALREIAKESDERLSQAARKAIAKIAGPKIRRE